MAIDAKKIAKRRSKDKEVDVDALLERHSKPRLLLEDIDSMALWMTSAVVSMLSDMFDDLTAEGEFRSSFHRSFRRLLNTVNTREEKVVFFHEAIPGFTALVVKKLGWAEWVHEEAVPKSTKSRSIKDLDASPSPSSSQDSDIEEDRNNAVQSIIHAYVHRTGNRVIFIEGKDLNLVLFPASDLRHNLREMGFLG